MMFKYLKYPSNSAPIFIYFEFLNSVQLNYQYTHIHFTVSTYYIVIRPDFVLFYFHILFYSVY